MSILQPSHEIEAPAQNLPKTKRQKVTLRSVVLGMGLAPFIAWWNMNVETIRYAGQPTTISLYLHVLFILLCFITLNGVIGRIVPKWRFTPAELLTT